MRFKDRKAKPFKILKSDNLQTIRVELWPICLNYHLIYVRPVGTQVCKTDSSACFSTQNQQPKTTQTIAKRAENPHDFRLPGYHINYEKEYPDQDLGLKGKICSVHCTKIVFNLNMSLVQDNLLSGSFNHADVHIPNTGICKRL